MGLLGRLLGAAPTQSDGARIASGVRTLLAREVSFNRREREVFWGTHISQTVSWYYALGFALFSETLEEARAIDAIRRELANIVVGTENVAPENASKDASALRALVFSGSIEFMQQVQDVDNARQWASYREALTLLGMSPASTGTSLGHDGPATSSSPESQDQRIQALFDRYGVEDVHELLPYLLPALDHIDPEGGHAACSALSTIGEIAIPGLIYAIRELGSDREILRELSAALKGMGIPALPYIRAALWDVDSNVRLAAVLALPDTSGQGGSLVVTSHFYPFVDDPMLRMFDPDPHVRTAAAAALGYNLAHTLQV